MIIDNDILNSIKIVNVINKKKKFYKYNLNNDIIIQTDIKSLIIKIFYIIILVVLFIFLYRGKYIKLIHNKDIYRKYLNVEFDSSNTSFNKAINHLKNCLSPNLVKFQPSLSFKFEEPKISVVIPLYNCQKFILRGVKSIQYQNISEIEIILIEDYSKDNTLSIIEKIQKEDKRVRIIKNKKNMGVLYSRSIGVLSAKGKYLFTLDNDDLFLNNNIFDFTSKIADEGKFDIVEFKAISNRILNDDLINNKIIDAKFFKNKNKIVILYQPELGMYPIDTFNKTGSYYLRDIFLWGKCIKTNIYQTALNKFGFDRYSRFMIRYEDILVNYMIFNIANSFIFIPKYGIYHFNRLGSGASIGWKKVSRSTNILYLIDAIIDFSLDYEKNKKLAAYIIIYFLKLGNAKRTLISNKYNIELITSCIKRILNSPYISNIHKNEIKKIVNKMTYIKLK